MKKGRLKKVFLWIIGIFMVFASLALIGYPFISNYLNSLNSDSEVLSYLNSADNLSNDKYSEMLEAAQKYNENLVGNVTVGDPFSYSGDTAEEYNSLLSIDSSPIMASIEIPSINVNLAIYHGTAEDALQNGVGHLDESSLPVGGLGTHAVLTGHTGLSSKKLFSDVASLDIGDVFFIHVLGDTLAYKIDEINTVLPTDTEKLQIDPQQDYVTLVTCTPFGINTHRLLVRGTRIPYEEAEELISGIQADKRSTTWGSEYIKALLLGLAVMLIILAVFTLVKIVLYIYRKRKVNDKKDI